MLFLSGCSFTESEITNPDYVNLASETAISLCDGLGELIRFNYDYKNIKEKSITIVSVEAYCVREGDWSLKLKSDIKVQNDGL